MGILSILLACWGVDSLIGLSSVSFPASVALLIVLFFGLIILEIFIGEKRAKSIVKVIDIPVGVFSSLRFNHGVDVDIGWILFKIHQRIFHAFIRSVLFRPGLSSTSSFRNHEVLVA
jgi:hypothetical protein